MSTPTAGVLGAAGGTGALLVDELVRRGYRVRAVTRAGVDSLGDRLADPDVEHVAADIRDTAQLRAALEGCAVVFHAAQPAYHRWAQELPAMIESVLAATAAAGARLVVADNLYLYGPHDGLLTEDLPSAATTKKGRARADMAKRLWQAHADDMLPVTLGRSSDYYGPNGLNTHGGRRVFAAAIARKPVRLVGRLDQPHTWSYLPDMARALVTLAEHDIAYGRAWHLPVAPPLTGNQFLELVLEASGATSGRPATTGAAMLRIAGIFDRTARELSEMMYQFDAPFVVDDRAFREQIGAFDSTPHLVAIHETIDWFRGPLMM